ncbi:hypothetical protein MRX96_059732 [Rhipicephalus microplus]
MKRPRSPCFAGQRRRRKLLRRLHDSEAASAAPLLRRKRSLDCGLDRTLGSPPPVKRPRLDDSHAFLWEIQETPKEPTFGKDSKHNKQHKNGSGASGGPCCECRTGAIASGYVSNGRSGAAPGRTGRPPASDDDNPAFNAFNYWKTPFPDVSVDVIME